MLLSETGQGTRQCGTRKGCRWGGCAASPVSGSWELALALEDGTWGLSRVVGARGVWGSLCLDDKRAAWA